MWTPIPSVCVGLVRRSHTISRAILVSSSKHIRTIHTVTSISHYQPDWPHRSAEYFRETRRKEREEKEKARAELLANAPPPVRVEHPHPVHRRLGPGPQHFAVFRFRNQQYKAVVGDLLMMDLVDAQVGEKIVVDDVMLLGGRDASLIGRPCIQGARVVLQLEEHTHTQKVIVFKKKRRKTYKRKAGHRAEVSMLRVLSVDLPAGIDGLTSVHKEDGSIVKPRAPVLRPVKQIFALLDQASREKLIARRTRHLQRRTAKSANVSERLLKFKSQRASGIKKRFQPRREGRVVGRKQVSTAAAGARAFSTLARRPVIASSSSSSSSATSFHSSSLTSNEATPATNTNESTIESLLRTELSASTLQIEDTSGGCGAFFRLLVVSPKFAGLSLVKQHRLVNETLKPHIANLHGLTLTTFTEEQWKKQRAQA